MEPSMAREGSRIMRIVTVVARRGLPRNVPVVSQQTIVISSVRSIIGSHTRNTVTNSRRKC